MHAVLRSMVWAICLFPLIAVGQQLFEMPPELQSQYKRAAENTAATVVGRVIPLLSADQQALARKVKIRIKDNSWDLFGTIADKEGDTRVIVIPLGLVVTLDWIDTAVAAQAVNGVDMQVLSSYVSALNRTINQDLIRINAKVAPNPLPVFPAYAHLPQDEWFRMISTPEFARTKDAIKLSSFGFLVLHELAHHIEPDAFATVDVFKREPFADKFAARWSVAADLNPLAAIYTVLFFASLEGDESARAGGVGGYPPAICRAAYFLMQGRAQALKDADFEKFMRQRGLWNDLMSMPDKLQKLLADDHISCGSGNTKAIEDDFFTLGRTDTGRASSEQVVSQRLNVRIWDPTPGSCDGIRFDLYIDGTHVKRIDNTRSPDTAIGTLHYGVHSFSFKNIKLYCIEGESPFRMKAVASQASCGGNFTVGGGNALSVAMPLPDLSDCALN